MKNLIKPARAAKGLSQTELAIQSGINRSSLSVIESGDRCNYTTAQKIANALDTSIEFLFPGEKLNGAPKPIGEISNEKHTK